MGSGSDEAETRTSSASWLWLFNFTLHCFIYPLWGLCRSYWFTYALFEPFSL